MYYSSLNLIKENDAMKICNKHGELNDDQIRTYIRNRRGRSEVTQACKLCHRETASTARNKDRTRANEWARQDRKLNPEKYRKYEKTYIEKHGIEHVRRKEVLRTHKLTIEDHEELIKIQNNLCAICNKKETRAGRTKGSITPLCIDHCHDCRNKGHNDIRGLLCHDCNSGMGKFKDSIEMLKKAIQYLKRHKCGKKK